MSRRFIARVCVGVVCTPLFLVLLAFAALPQKSDNTILTIKTQFGDVVIERDPSDNGWIRFRSTKIELPAGIRFATKEGIFNMKEGDVLVLSVPAPARGVPPGYYVFLVHENTLTDLIADKEKFDSADWTFKITRSGNELLFDLGFDHKKKKTAIYRDGVLYVGVDLTGRIATVPKAQCVGILNDVAYCGQFNRKLAPNDCTQESVEAAYSSGAVSRRLYAESNLPVFTPENFYRVCASICKSGADEAMTARKILCGY